MLLVACMLTRVETLFSLYYSYLPSLSKQTAVTNWVRSAFIKYSVDNTKYNDRFILLAKTDLNGFLVKGID